MAARPTAHYWQGMNFLAAFVLIVFRFRAERAFWAVWALLDNVTVGLFGPSGPRIEIDMVATLIRDRLPRLSGHLLKRAVPLETFTTGWIITMFTTALPSATVLWVWDMVIVGSAPHQAANSGSAAAALSGTAAGRAQEGGTQQQTMSIRAQIATDITHLLTVAVLQMIEPEVLQLDSAQDVNSGIRAATAALDNIEALKRAAEDLVRTK